MTEALLASERATKERTELGWVERFASYNAKCDPADPVCGTCLSWYGTNHATKHSTGPMLPPICKLSTLQNLQNDMKQPWWDRLTETEKVNYQIAQDPVMWASVRLRNHADPATNWKPETYQLGPLRCTSQKMLLLFGRQLGKTECMAVKILNRMDTRPGYKIVVVVPFLAQASDIYSRLLAFLSVSPDLKNRLKRQREAPIYEITLDNNSRVRIFTAGERTGKSASDVRGQSADWLILDEAAQLSNETIVSIMATLTRARVPEIFVSSTPLESVGRFYSWATDPLEGFRVFWCPSSSAPEWTDETEMFYRRTYSRAHYAREYEAKFGHSEKGVFRNQDLAAEGVIQDYDIYSPVPDHTNEIYIIGVDWNSTGNGVVVLVYGWNNNLCKFVVKYREVIDPEEFTQLTAVDRIVQLNAVWKAKYIYVDDGFGKTQVEILKKYGVEHPQTGLAHKVRAIAMNSPIEIRDPLTKSKIKKQAKNLLVEMARAKLESQQCIFPKSEDHKDGLVGQIRAYQVDRVSPSTGLKVFSQGNEHLLTAWLLALGGFLIEFTDLTRVRLATDIVKLDPDLKLIKTVMTEAERARATTEQNRLRQPSRTEQRKLDITSAIRYANTGLPEGVRRQLDASNSAPTRKGWR